jgi:dethiobiotin synthetase
MAAAREGKTVPFGDVVAWCAEKHGLVEGVGGVMVPLDGTKTVREWMVALGWPVILVTGSYLGSISHTLTAMAVLQQAGLTVPAVIISESAENNVGLLETRAALAPFMPDATVLVTLPRSADWKQAEMDLSWIR